MQDRKIKLNYVPDGLRSEECSLKPHTSRFNSLYHTHCAVRIDDMQNQSFWR
ncbi:unnamed protein product, partial [Sphenostylis stenocarpa]